MKQIFLFFFVATLFSFSANAQTVTSCNFTYPKLEFKEGSCALTADTKTTLNQLAADMAANPDCSITLVLKAQSKLMQKITGCRTEAIRKYLDMKGIALSRVKVTTDKKTDSDTIETEPANSN
ncbi:MAG: hypothetical protein U0X40_11825 [Ferruginibacter sp.]